jgi:hypothetical protein
MTLAALVLATGVAAWQRGRTGPSATTAPPKVSAKMNPVAPAESSGRSAASANAPAATATATVLISSEPSGARVTVDEVLAGRTPLTLTVSLPRDVSLALPGYRPLRQHITAPGSLRVRLVPRAAAPTRRLLDE